ncbi:MAG: DUF1045 domain-containing protein [Roseovarius sp.]
MHFTRYAIYFTPPDGDLADLGAAWLGWDSATGQPVRAPDLPDLPAPAHEITGTARRYGLHATLVAPFRLAGGRTEAALLDAFTRFCKGADPVTLDGLEIAAMGRFLALVPEGCTGALDALAARAVQTFGAVRAPLDAATLARRRTASLTPDQDANLVRWGYPYVMSAFRFHITLTGKRPRSELPAIRQAIARHLMPAVPRPFPVDALSLMGEDAQDRFHLIRRHRLCP